MKRLLAEFVLRLALCGLGAWLGWRLLGAVGLVVTAPLFGVALARPLMDLAGLAWHGTRVQAWRPVEGRFYAFRGQPVAVVEDVSHRRWLRLADVRQAVALGRSDQALAHEGAARVFETEGDWHVEAEALLEALRREPGDRALKFHHWVERDVAFPARQRRRRLGIRDTRAPQER